MEIYNADDKVDPCYGLEEEIVNEEMIKALLLGKKLYTTINCGEYAITIKYERGADNKFTNARELGELKDTIEDMLSDDYKERFKAEYKQLIIRLDRLNKIINEMKEDKLDYKVIYSLDVLVAQYRYMYAYADILRYRAQAEGINLD